VVVIVVVIFGARLPALSAQWISSGSASLEVDTEGFTRLRVQATQWRR